MNSQVSIEVRAEGAASADFPGSFEGLNHPRKGPQAERPGMRFAFLIHPLSQQTTDLMALDRDGRLRQDLGPGRPARVLHRSPCRIRARHRPISDGRSLAPRIADTFDGLVSAAGARAEGRLYEIPMDARSILDDPGRARAHGASRRGRHRLGCPHRRARLDDRHHRQPRRVSGRAPADRRDDGQQPDSAMRPCGTSSIIASTLGSTWPTRRSRSWGYRAASQRPWPHCWPRGAVAWSLAARRTSPRATPRGQPARRAAGGGSPQSLADASRSW